MSSQLDGCLTPGDWGWGVKEFILHLNTSDFTEACLDCSKKPNIHENRCALKASPLPRTCSRQPLHEDLRFHLQGSALSSLCPNFPFAACGLAPTQWRKLGSFLLQQVQYVSVMILVGLWSTVQKANNRLWR